MVLSTVRVVHQGQVERGVWLRENRTLTLQPQLQELLIGHWGQRVMEHLAQERGHVH